MHQLSLTRGYLANQRLRWARDELEIVQVPVRSLCGAIDSRLKDLLVLGETRDVATQRNIHMDPDTRALSAQLYYLLIMVCQEGAQQLLEHAGDTEGGVAWRLLDEYEPRAAGRQCALLQELLHYGFSRNPRVALGEFEVLLLRYSALSGEDVSESLKVTLVQKGITIASLLIIRTGK